MNLDLIRSFLEIAARGSLTKAAARLRVSQSTLTRQMQTLEEMIGGSLLERGAGGVALTASGHALLETVGPALEKLDSALGEVRKLARGQSTRLRIGYIQSAAREYLNPALAALRRAHPEVKVTLQDLSPGEQIGALRRGELDIALIGQAGALIDREFYVKRLATLPIMIALSDDHPLAARTAVSLSDLKGEHFVGAHDLDMPGYNHWVAGLCRRAGFRARFIGDADSLTHGLATVVTDRAVLLIPDYAEKNPVPGIALRPLKSPAVKWDLLIAWQRGAPSKPLLALLDAFPQGEGR